MAKLIVDRRIYRQLGKADRGPVYTFDIDKTYLDTRMSTWRDVIKIPLEIAVDKRPYTGIVELMRACQRGSDHTGPDRPVFFVSASPAQMRPILERRMELDEVTVDGLTLKNWMHYIKRVQLSGLRQQIPYKLSALLATRAELPPACSEVLFGDDTEADAYIYSLYSAIVMRRMSAGELLAELEKQQVPHRESTRLVEQALSLEPLLARMAEQTPRPVAHIFIHGVIHKTALLTCAKGIAPEVYLSPLLPAALLYREGWIRDRTLRAVFKALRDDNAFKAAESLEQVRPLLGELKL